MILPIQYSKNLGCDKQCSIHQIIGIQKKINIGDKIQITSDNPAYNKWRNKTWTVSRIDYGTEDHPGYDEGVGPLISCKGLPVSLYDWEFEIV